MAVIITLVIIVAALIVAMIVLTSKVGSKELTPISALGVESREYPLDENRKIREKNYDGYDEVQKATINKLLESKQNVYVVSIKGPTDQQYFRGLVNYACLYEYTPNSIRTIIKQLKEKFEFKGKLPL